MQRKREPAGVLLARLAAEVEGYAASLTTALDAIEDDERADVWNRLYLLECRLWMLAAELRGEADRRRPRT